MHLAFVDIVYDYAADRPDREQPLGGTTSAICFLAREMVKTGIRCTIFNKVTKPTEAYGIVSYPLEALTDERRNAAYSAFIFCGRWIEWLVQHIREATDAPLIAWMQESLLVPPLVPPLPALDAIAFNSEWQKKINQPYVLPHWRQIVLRNAMNPAFAALFPPGEPIMAAKTTPPVLLYAGVTPRGAFHLPALLEHLRRLRTDFTVEICCDCAPSRDAKANGGYLEYMRKQPNVTHVGMVPQRELADRMKRAAVFLSPNPWPETSCIALIEALAAGLCAITTNRAVLPETSEGFAQHVAIEDADNPTRFDMAMPYAEFAEAINQTMTMWLTRTDAMERSLRSQINHIRGRYQYSQRVQPWVEFINGLVRFRGKGVRVGT